MTQKNDRSRLWDILEKARACLLTTLFAGGLRERPREVGSAQNDSENQLQRVPIST